MRMLLGGTIDWIAKTRADHTGRHSAREVFFCLHFSLCESIIGLQPSELAQVTMSPPY